MSRPLGPEQLAELGLIGFVSEEPETITIQPDGTTHGLSQSVAPVDTTALGLDALNARLCGEFTTLKTRATIRFGASVELSHRDPDWMRITFDSARPVPSINCIPQATDCVRSISRHACLAHVPVGTRVALASAAEALVIDRTQRGKLLFYRAGKLETGDLIDRSEIHAWLASCTDTWIRERVGRELSRADNWHAIVAAGLYARLLDLKPARAREAVTDFIATGSVPEIDCARRWARALSDLHVEIAESLAAVEAQRLSTELHEFAWTADAPVAAVEQICEMRDDLECAAWVVEQAGAGAELASLLETLDDDGDRFADCAKALNATPSGNERLCRVADRDLDAWWGLVSG